MEQFLPFEQKMRSVGLGDAAIGAFHRCFDTLVTNQSGMIPESSILPASDVTNWDDIMSGTTPASADIISQSVCIKLNGGLGTSMGLQKAKSLLPVKGDLTFLDLIVKQVKHLRDISGTPVRLLLMNSFSTSKDTLAYLEKYAKDGFNNPAEMELMQNRVPKILQDSLTPATWAQNPDQEWCPPGHGDIYPALLGSGWLDRLLADGVKYAFISNADNLGAQIDLRFLRWFAESGAPFVMEVT
ncbi:MAG: UTP--glucose-1-phosphate uridylyltransferase, partial [Akkermansia sp.]